MSSRCGKAFRGNSAREAAGVRRRVLLRGLLIGNVLALTLGWLQYHFNLIKLNPEVYYLDAVPIELSFWNFILINALTFSTCMAALLLPSSVVSRISPIKALKFQ